MPLPRSVERVLSSEQGLKAAAVVIASLFVISVASVGQVQHEIDRANRTTALVAGGTDGPGIDRDTTTVPGTDPTGSSTTVPVTAIDVPGTTAGGTGGTNTTATIPVSAIPDFGLKTQGVTAKTVKIGMSYNVAACGDSGTLSAMLGSSVTGDPKRAIEAFTRHVNDTGGIGGRTLETVIVDDGGDGCPEKNSAAAVEMAEEHKVFLGIPGLHVVSDGLMARKIPVFGGRDDPESMARIGANGLMLTEPLEPTFEMWASLGKYELESQKQVPCLVRPESGASGDWNSYEKILTAKTAKYGFNFADIVVYKEDVGSAQQQSSAAVARMKSKGCNQIYLLAGNPIAWIFFTSAASQALWYPSWTFTPYTALADTELAGRLMDSNQWSRVTGLSARVPNGHHPKQGNCQRIYESYYPDDGQSTSASVQIVCAQILTSSEIMRRAVQRTGVLTGNSLLVGADSIKGDWAFDATVPLTYSFPSAKGPFKPKAFDHMTVVKWDTGQSVYTFPYFPTYWRVMGAGKGGGEDLRAAFARAK